jgi:hypothetical protein
VKPALALVVVTLLAAPLPAGVAQERTATPSAEELWRSYPLETRPAPVASPAPAPARTPVPPRPAEGGPPVIPLALLGVLIALGVLVLSELRRGRRGDGEASSPPPAYKRVRALAPPDPHRAWTAAIEWHESGAEGCFRVLVRRGRGDPGSVLAESPPLAWPPVGPAAVQALATAAERLEATLLATGWRRLAPGDQWYSKRFAWEPPGAHRQARPRGRAAAHAR